MTVKEIGNTISEKTKMPLGTVVAILVGLIGIITWAATLEARVGIHEKIDDARVSEIQAKIEVIQSVDRRLSRIEWKLGIK